MILEPPTVLRFLDAKLLFSFPFFYNFRMSSSCIHITALLLKLLIGANDPSSLHIKTMCVECPIRKDS